MFCDYLHRLLGAACAPQVRAQIVIRLGSQAQAVNFVELTVEFALPRTQKLCEHLQRLVSALGFVLVDAQPGVLAPSQPLRRRR